MIPSIIVTGATGFLGRNFLRYVLQNTEFDIYAVLRPSSQNARFLTSSPRIHIILASLEEIERSVDDFPLSCAAFYHFAWGGVNRNEIDSEELQQQNIKYSLSCANLAKALGCRLFVDAGSRAEYGMPDGSWSEEALCHPLTAYGRAKLAFYNSAKEIFSGSSTRFVHARIFSVYGADDHPWSLIHSSVSKMLRNEPLELGHCTQDWNFMEITDFCDLMLTFCLLGEEIPAGDNGIFNVATRDVRPLRKYVEEMREVLNSSSELHFGTFLPNSDSTFSVRPDTSKVEKTFHWYAKVPFSEGIQKMAKILRGGLS